MPTNNPIIKTFFERIFRNRLQFLPRILFHVFTVKKIVEIFPKIVGQFKIQMGRKFFQRYTWKYFQHRTGNSSYCLVGEVPILLEKKDIFHNLGGKRSKKVNKFSFLSNNFHFSWEKLPTT